MVRSAHYEATELERSLGSLSNTVFMWPEFHHHSSVFIRQRTCKLSQAGEIVLNFQQNIIEQQF